MQTLNNRPYQNYVGIGVEITSPRGSHRYACGMDSMVARLLGKFTNTDCRLTFLHLSLVWRLLERPAMPVEPPLTKSEQAVLLVEHYCDVLPRHASQTTTLHNLFYLT
jgi:hypothetical protein